MPKYLVDEPVEKMLCALGEALDLVDRGVVLVDHDMRVRLVNRAFLKLSGILPEQLNAGLRLRDLFDKDCEAGLRTEGDEPTPLHLWTDQHVWISCHRTTEGGRALICTTSQPQATKEDVRSAVQEEAEQLNAELRFNKETLEDQASYLAALAEESDANARRAEEARSRLEGEIAERCRLEAELRRLATTDALTGALNRRRFFELGEHELVHTREIGLHFGLLMINIDHFKTINDRYGHLVGDAALRKIVGVFRKSLRKVDLIGRLGGEEFSVAVATASVREVLVVAERLRRAVATNPLQDGSARIGMTVSIGVTIAGDTDHSLEELVARADAQLYVAKNSGRNRVCHAEQLLAALGNGAG